MADSSRKRRQSKFFQTPPNKQQRSDSSLLIRSLKCSNCFEKFRVESISKDLKAECYRCSTQRKTQDTSGYPFEMVAYEEQLAQNFQCPICLLIMRDATELPCHHLMCSGYLTKNEARLPGE